ncbi:MAG: DNA mismatch repair protein MutS [Christensenellaceae bacterium]|nr:DNA mismatch repair protein MutS [Christensenellaceae bacterium]
MNKLSPMMQQYMRIKEKHKDCILFFRLGDFYEMFFDDAILVSKELEITLTGKNCGLKERAPMCGVPFHSATNYIQKLVDNGHKVAICEQLSDPEESKGIVDRDVVRIITKGTFVDSTMLDESKNSFLASILISRNSAGISYADVSTGEFFAYSIDNYKEKLNNEIKRINPSEIIIPQNAENNLDYKDGMFSPIEAELFSLNYAKKILTNHFNLNDLKEIDFSNDTLAIRAAGALLGYIYDTQKNDLKHISSLKQYISNQNMYLDDVSRVNLEISETLNERTKKGSLLWIVDKSCTAMGARQIKSWVEQPLAVKEKIEERLNIVEELTKDSMIVDSIRASLNNVYDLERILSKISYKSINARDCLSILKSLNEVPQIKTIIANSDNIYLKKYLEKLDRIDNLCELIEASIDEDPPLNMSEGGFIKEGFSKTLDDYRNSSRKGKEWLLELENKEKNETGIKNLKIGYNKIFGYFFEVTKSNLSLVPIRFIRRQTLTNSERYVTSELQEIENKIIGASQNSNRLEIALFDEIREAITAVISRIQNTANILKMLDAYCAFAIVAIDNQYVKPIINDDGYLEIKDGRHPVLEKTIAKQEFIPNDINMNLDDERMLIITGPNMAGKSTYMRQNALIVLMAHFGSFVPASYANICITDRIFTRIGASDNISSGQSTFMVEMTQTANILKNATKNSLILLDEIGRGTSTFDGLSIAWAVVEYISNKNKIGAKTIFATHYHELSSLENHLDGVKNYSIQVKEHGNDILFLRKIIPGSADKSYGIHVAMLAGLPIEVIKNAQRILARIEASDINNHEISKNIIGKKEETVTQTDFFHIKHDELVEYIKKIDVMSLTPIQAISELFKISEKANKI